MQKSLSFLSFSTYRPINATTFSLEATWMVLGGPKRKMVLERDIFQPQKSNCNFFRTSSKRWHLIFWVIFSLKEKKYQNWILLNSFPHSFFFLFCSHCSPTSGMIISTSFYFSWWFLIGSSLQLWIGSHITNFYGGSLSKRVPPHNLWCPI